MKPWFIRTFFTIACIIFFSISNVNAQDVIESVKTRLKCSRNEAIQFIGVVESFIKDLQKNISQIASHSTDNRTKDYLIKTTIEQYFLKPSSKVQVSSLHRSFVNSYRVDKYLRRLADLSKTQYTEVELMYVPSYLALGTIQSYYDSTYGKAYEFNVSMWTIFRAKFGESIAYEDVTLKTYGFFFYKSKRTNKWKLRIKGIAAKETVPFKQYEKHIKKIWRNE